ncbi:bestrophin-like domain [Thermocatellispora tengchongensis]
MGWLTVLAVAAFGAMVIALTVLRRKGRVDEERGSVALDFAANLALAVYLLVLAYAAVLCRDAVTAANADAAAEAESLTELYWSVAPIKGAEPIQEKVRLYTDQSIKLDWPMMARDRLSETPDLTLEQMRADLLRLKPATDAEKDLRQDALAHAAEVSHARGIRADDAASRLEPIFMITMLISGVIVIALPWILGVRPTAASVLSDVVRVAIVVAGLLFIQLMSHPYSGLPAVEPTAFQAAQSQYDRIDAQFPPPPPRS